MRDNFPTDFPLLKQMVNHEHLVYLDSAATSQMPEQVMAAITDFKKTDNANVHRGVYTLAQRATERYEGVREQVAAWIGANDAREIVFTKGTTEGLNWLARSLKIHQGDKIVLTMMEHHSNIVPWQQVAHRLGAELVYIEMTPDFQLDMADAQRKIDGRTAVVATTLVSNVLGTVTPVRELAHLAHRNGAVIVGDGAQAVPHMPIDVKQLELDYLTFSGHKMLGPNGIGVLWGKKALLDDLDPVEFGGEMISEVGLNETTFKPTPWKFEAGTQNITGVIGLGAAIDYLQMVGWKQIQQNNQQLVQQALTALAKIPGLEIYGKPTDMVQTGIISFNLAGIHPHDVATALDMQGIAVRAGHHCAQPLMKALGVPATCRASFYLYNTTTDVTRFVDALVATKEFFTNGIS
ncbi:SufS family cysteine desulfurase [Ligilactobacillus saerimneri]